MVELCLHAANVLYLLSFLGRDMLWLRVLTCAGLALGVVFFSCQPTPLYGPAAWHVAFLLINAVQICRLLRERRELALSAEQQEVSDALFRDLSREQLLALLTRAISSDPGRLWRLPQLGRAQLTPEERALRDIAFSRLSRQELLNLLTRRLWNSIARLSPRSWRGRRGAAPAIGHPEPREAVAHSKETQQWVSLHG